VLALGGVIHFRFCFFILSNVFAFAFVAAFRQAAMRWLAAASALIPMAQMKPSNSRPTAVTTFLRSLPAADSRQ
jgi:hypothetical protein